MNNKIFQLTADPITLSHGSTTAQPPSYNLALSAPVPSTVIEEEEERSPADPKIKNGEGHRDVDNVTLSVDSSPPTYEEALEILRKAEQTRQQLRVDFVSSSNTPHAVRSAAGSPVIPEWTPVLRRTNSFDPLQLQRCRL